MYALVLQYKEVKVACSHKVGVAATVGCRRRAVELDGGRTSVAYSNYYLSYGVWTACAWGW